MDRLRAACNCSMYFMAQLDNRTIMCGKSKLNCVMQVIRAFAMKPNTTYSCRCQPSCWDLSYESTMSMAPILRAANIAGATGIDKQELVALSVFFTRSYYRQYNRNPAVSFTDFLCKQSQHFFLHFICSCSVRNVEEEVEQGRILSNFDELIFA